MLIMKVEFVFPAVVQNCDSSKRNRCKNIIFRSKLSLILSQQRTKAEKTKLLLPLAIWTVVNFVTKRSCDETIW